MPLKFRSRGGTHVGQVRAINQDSILLDSQSNVYIVADGMGGHAGGEIASRMAIETVHKSLGQIDTKLEADFTRMAKAHSDAINNASTKIYERALEDQDLKGMGTTATVIQVVGNKAFCGHVGDSRLYLIRCGFIFQITTDHSLVGEQLQAGLITEEEAANHQWRNVITRSVGFQEEEYVDTYQVPIQPGDFFLLCSDGLYTKIADRDISILVQRKGCDGLLLRC